MRIGVLTIHNIKNYGSILQAYATAEVIRRLGHTVEIIDCWNPALESPRSVKVLRMGNRLAFWMLGHLCQVKAADAKFQSFLAENVPLSLAVATRQALEQLVQKYDCVMAGSDQIWHPRCLNDKMSFLLDFVFPPMRKIAFSSSFGVTKLPAEHVEMYARELNTFDAIAVREASAQELVRALTGKEVPVVLDPTLLLSGDEWGRLASVEKEAGPYILIYGNMSNKGNLMEQVALRIQKRTGWRILRVHGHAHHVFSRKINYLFDVGPKDVLRLFQGASLVLANSFHGTAFAVNFNRPFFSFYPKGDDLGIRQKHLLTLLQLEAQAVELPMQDIAECDSWVWDVDYTQANRCLNQRRADAVNWLKGALQ